MKYDKLHDRPKNWFSSGASFHETTIIDLHNVLLTNGIHRLATNSLNEGRDLMELLLLSLNHFQAVAFLSLDNSFKHNVEVETILHQELFQNCLLGEYNFEEYLLQDFDYDFLWIESSYELSAQPWFRDFERCLTKLAIDQHMPVLMTTHNDGF